MHPVQIRSSLIRFYQIKTSIALVGFDFFETRQANGLAVLDHVILASQRGVALETAKMLHVESRIFGQTILRHENQLVARLASRNAANFRKIPPAINVVRFFVIKIHHIRKRLIATAAREATGVKQGIGPIYADHYRVIFEIFPAPVARKA